MEIYRWPRTCHVTGEMQMKARMRHRYTPIRVAVAPNAGTGGERQDSRPSLEGLRSGTATLENSSVVSYKTKFTLSIHFSNYKVYPQETKASSHRNLHVHVTAALFWWQGLGGHQEVFPNGSAEVSCGAWHSALKRELSGCGKTWRKPKHTSLCGLRRCGPPACHPAPILRPSRKWRLQTVQCSVVVRDWGKEGWRGRRRAS